MRLRIVKEIFVLPLLFKATSIRGSVHRSVGKTVTHLLKITRITTDDLSSCRDGRLLSPLFSRVHATL